MLLLELPAATPLTSRPPPHLSVSPVARQAVKNILNLFNTITIATPASRVKTSQIEKPKTSNIPQLFVAMNLYEYLLSY